MTEAAAGRVARGLAAAGWSLAFFALTYLFFALAALPLFATLGGTHPAVTLLIQSALLLGAAFASTWLVGFRLAQLDPHALGWKPARPWRGAGVGAALGAAAAGAALLLAVLLGSAGWLPDGGTVATYAGTLMATLLVLAPAALAEEVLFRGVPLVLLAAAIGRWPAVLGLSVLFALAHLGNPHATALGLVNIGLAGVFLSLVFLAPGGLWAATGAHLAWNGTLAALDAPVSGLPLQVPLIDFDAGGPGWVTGGAFGPEGGLAATAALTAACAAASLWARKDTA